MGAVDDDIGAEDELALGAESADFQLVESRRKKAARKAAQAARATPAPTPTPVPTPTPRAKTTSGRKTPPTRRAAASSAPTPSRDRVESAPWHASSLHGPHDALTWLQTQQLAQTLAANARPAKPFEDRTPAQYAILMSKFDNIVKERGMDARATLIELSNWFEGSPKLIVDAESVDDDPEEAYKRARAELDMLFGRNNNTTINVMSIVEKGKALEPNDKRAHVALFAELRSARAAASKTTNADDLDRLDILRKIIDRKVPHLSEHFWKKDEKARLRGEPRMKFSDLLAAIKFRAGLLTAKGDQEKTTTKIAAISSSAPSSGNQPEVMPEKPRMVTYADRVAN